MPPAIYTDLVPWYHLLDPAADHEGEAETFTRAFERAASFPARTLLELGAGAGNNAFHLKRRFDCTLADLSPHMQRLSREQNPECAHVIGDMRSLRLGRTYDVVLVHDAICYMTTEADLRAAVETAFVHTRPGGAAIFAPDHVREGFREHTALYEADDPASGKSLRCIEWTWDPDPADTTYAVEYAFLMREGGTVRAAHDPHVEGLFPNQTWLDVLSGAGYRVTQLPRPPEEDGFAAPFLCSKPA